MTSDVISKGASDDRFIGSPQDVNISQYFGSGEEFAYERMRKFHNTLAEQNAGAGYDQLLFISFVDTIIVLIAN